MQVFPFSRFLFKLSIPTDFHFLTQYFNQPQLSCVLNEYSTGRSYTDVALAIGVGAVGAVGAMVGHVAVQFIKFVFFFLIMHEHILLHLCYLLYLRIPRLIRTP